MKITLQILIALLINLTVCSQTQLFVYHGRTGESSVYDANQKPVNKPAIKIKQGDSVLVNIVNPNPLLYNYTVKFENLSLESEDKSVTDLLNVFSKILSARVNPNGFVITSTADYKDAITILVDDINKAKKIILDSDIPESPNEAMNLIRSAGLRKALDDISNLANDKYHFNNINLLSDLNTVSDLASTQDFEKQAFRLLNASLVEKVNEIKKNTSPQTISSTLKTQIKATDSVRRIYLVINKIDKTNNLKRDGAKGDYVLEVATLVPLYKRSVLEIVPVANFIFSKSNREFYLDNNIIQERFKTKTTTAPGAILNINVARFGETKEMSIGIGPGYKFSSKGDALENFYFSSLFSYKNFIRVGLGFGFAQFPTEELKGGVKAGQPLPSSIANLNDILQYEEKPSIFLTISFTGLNLTSKK